MSFSRALRVCVSFVIFSTLIRKHIIYEILYKLYYILFGSGIHEMLYTYIYLYNVFFVFFFCNVLSWRQICYLTIQYFINIFSLIPYITGYNQRRISIETNMVISTMEKKIFSIERT